MKILVIKTSSLGDIVHTLPALTDAVTAFPEIRFDWVIEEAFAEIPTWHSAINRIIPIAWRRWRKKLWQPKTYQEIVNFLEMLRQTHYDYIIDAQGLIKSALLSKLAHGKNYGYAKNSVRETSASFAYDVKFSIAKNQHAISRTRQLFARTLGYRTNSAEPNYGINSQLFASPIKQEKYLLFFHGTSRTDKCWSENKWIELGQLAATNGFMVYLPWGNEIELQRAKHIASACKNAKVLPKLSLTTIAGLILHSNGVVAVDTGLGHIAAALGRPTVSLYGPTDPKLIGTWGKNQIHLCSFREVTAEDVMIAIIPSPQPSPTKSVGEGEY